MKRCSKCKQTKPISDYGMSSSAADKLMHRCKKCNRKVSEDHYAKSHGTKAERVSQQNTLHKFIKYLRGKGYTLKAIAKETGLDESSISYYLSGKRKVGMQAVRKYEAVEGK